MNHKIKPNKTKRIKKHNKTKRIKKHNKTKRIKKYNKTKRIKNRKKTKRLKKPNKKKIYGGSSFNLKDYTFTGDCYCPTNKVNGSGWIKLYDTDTELYYWVNKAEQRSSWKLPLRYLDDQNDVAGSGSDSGPDSVSGPDSRRTKSGNFSVKKALAGSLHATTHDAPLATDKAASPRPRSPPKDPKTLMQASIYAPGDYIEEDN